MTDFTPDEWMSVCISRQVEDGEVLAQGINTPLVMAGYILAKLTHAPNVQFASAIAQGICQTWSALSITYAEDFWLKESLMNVGFAVATADLLPTYTPKEFFRPAQIDSHGNFNNIAFKDKLRLPGAGGIPDVTTHATPVYCMCHVIRALPLFQRWIISVAWGMGRVIWSAIWVNLIGIRV